MDTYVASRTLSLPREALTWMAQKVYFLPTKVSYTEGTFTVPPIIIPYLLPTHHFFTTLVIQNHTHQTFSW